MEKRFMFIHTLEEAAYNNVVSLIPRSRFVLEVDEISLREEIGIMDNRSSWYYEDGLGGSYRERTSQLSRAKYGKSPVYHIGNVS